MKRWLGVCTLLALLVVAGLLAWQWQLPTKPNLLLIIVDTLRADRLGCYGYTAARTPNIDQLARQGCRFENAYCQVPLTTPSHTSIMTGTNPTKHGVRDNHFYVLPPDLPTLAEILAGEGYRTAAVVSCAPLSHTKGFARGFTHYDDNLDQKKAGPYINLYLEQRQGMNSTEVAIRFLQNLASGSAPFFLWLHLYDPHIPYDPPAPFAQSYDGEIAYSDYCIGRLLQQLKQCGQDQNTLIVFTADHGEGLGDHQEKTHGYFLYNSTLKVPLIFQASFIHSRKITHLARSIDILPTILGLLRINYHGCSQGRNLAPLILGQADPVPQEQTYSYAETYYPYHSFGWRVTRALIGPRYKYIATRAGELYDLQKDPNEKHNLLSPPSPAHFKSLAQTMQQQLTWYRQSSAQPHQNLSSGLQGGSYWAFAPPDTNLPEDQGPDPICQVSIMNNLIKAQSLAYYGQRTRAITILQNIVHQDSGNIAAWMLLGRLYADTHKLNKALAAFRQIRSLRPSSQQARDAIIDILFRQKHYAQGHQLIEQAIRRHNANALVYSRLAYWYLHHKQYRAAAQAARQARNLDPTMPSAWLYLGLALWKQHKYRQACQILKTCPLEQAKPHVKQEAQQFLQGPAGILTEMLHLGDKLRCEQQIGLYRLALQLDTHHGAIWFRLAGCYRQLKDWKNLVFAVTHLLQLQPQHPQKALLRCWLSEAQRHIRAN